MTAALTVLFLTGCASRQTIEPCDHPDRDGDTYRDWISWAVELDSALESCNVRIEAAQ